MYLLRMCRHYRHKWCRASEVTAASISYLTWTVLPFDAAAFRQLWQYLTAHAKFRPTSIVQKCDVVFEFNAPVFRIEIILK